MNTITTEEKSYPQRGVFGKILENALKSEGKWGSIIEYVKKHSDVYDLQVRANYLNVYYNGGNILRINPNSLDVDEFYFHTKIDRKDRNTRKTVIQENAKTGDKKAKEEAIKIIEQLSRDRDSILELIKSGNASPVNVKEYFDKMGAQMVKWENALFCKLIDESEKNKYKDKDCAEKDIYHKEKFIQQKITLANRDFENSDLVVLDVEFAVSDNAPYRSNDYTHPRFDMIAVDKKGRIHVLELKYGLGATGINNPGNSASDIKGHIEKFQKTVGGENYHKFIKDIQTLILAKKSLELSSLDGTNFIEEKPVFDIVYAEPGEGNLDTVVNFINNDVNNGGNKVANIWFINTTTNNFKLKQ